MVQFIYEYREINKRKTESSGERHANHSASGNAGTACSADCQHREIDRADFADERMSILEKE